MLKKLRLRDLLRKKYLERNLGIQLNINKQGDNMKAILIGLSKLLTKIITPEMKKQVFIFLGDKLVYSTKNKLDDKLWASVKKKF